MKGAGVGKVRSFLSRLADTIEPRRVDWREMQGEITRLRAVFKAAVALDERWHRGQGHEAEHSALCDALDDYWTQG